MGHAEKFSDVVDLVPGEVHAAGFKLGCGGQPAQVLATAGSAEPFFPAPSSPGFPFGITGDKLTDGVYLTLDWFSGTFPVGRLSEVEKIVVQFVGPFRVREKGMRCYKASKSCSSEGLLCWSEGRSEAWLSLNGACCNLIPADKLRCFLQSLRLLGVKSTRVDIAANFPRHLLDLERVHEAANNKQVSGFRRYEARKPVKNMDTGELEGNQANFGVRGGNGSGKYVRFYDKFLESKGEIDAIRFECEFSGECADIVFEALVDAADDDELRRVMAKRLGGCIDFVNKNGSHGHKDRFSRLVWWQRVIDLLGTAPVKVVRTKTTLQKGAEACKTQYASTCAKLVHVAENAGECGKDFVMRMVQTMLVDGERALKGWTPGPGDEVDFRSLLRPKPVFGSGWS